MEELGTAGVAKVMGSRKETVRVRLHRARLFLRRQLSPAPGRRVLPAKRSEPPESRHCRDLLAALSDCIDSIADESLGKHMQSDIIDCKLCEAFLTKLADAVRQCQFCRGNCAPGKGVELRRDLLQSYEAAERSLQARILSREFTKPTSEDVKTLV